MYTRHEQSTGSINQTAERVFARLDDHTRLSDHMSRRSWRMGWGKMETVLDAQRGQAVGSHIVLQGRVFGIRLFLDEIVTARRPPVQKWWETVGSPRLLVIGRYRMGFELSTNGSTTHIRVAIDYELPPRGFSRVLGILFGRAYARWCTRQKVRDAAC